MVQEPNWAGEREKGRFETGARIGLMREEGWTAM